MFLAYVDESGNEGPSLTFTLGCVLVDSSKWPDTFDEVIDYRRFLRDRFGLPIRAEVKANYLLRNRGPFFELGLSEDARRAIYRGFMRFQGKVGVSVFAIVIRKDQMQLQGKVGDPVAIAWEYFFQRLERLTTKGPGQGLPPTEVVLIHDDGREILVRSLARKARRAGSAGSAFGTGSLRRPARGILDDPSPRRSHENYFIQLADLNAYAAFRKIYPPGPKLNSIVPQDTWDELGPARYAPANGFAGGPPGLVSWPNPKR